MLAPICLFVYNRYSSLKKTIESLQNNELVNKSNLYIFSDGAKSNNEIEAISQVRNYVKTINGFAKIEIIERAENYGLAKNIIDGVTKIVHEYGKIIVLEDDLVTGKYFLKFMNDALELYENNLDVISINGYSYFKSKGSEDTYFLKTADNLGWGTWDRGWKIFEDNGQILLEKIKQRKLEYEFNRNNSYPFLEMLENQINGLNNSWAIRWYASAFLENKYTLYPNRSLVYHVGASDDATNYKKRIKDPLDVDLYQKCILVNEIQIEEQKNNSRQYNKFLLKYRIPSYKKIYSKIKKVFTKVIFYKDNK
jgi:hypothetical protein